MTQGHLFQLYNALIYPYLSYGILLWGFTYKTYLNKLVILQKKAVRIIGTVPYNSHTHGLFQTFKILKLNDIYKLYLGKHTFMKLNNLLPKPLLGNMTLCEEVHSHNTRQASQILKKRTRTALVANSFINKGPEYWNGLPMNLKTSFSTKSFNKHHRTHLLMVA